MALMYHSKTGKKQQILPSNKVKKKYRIFLALSLALNLVFIVKHFI